MRSVNMTRTDWFVVVCENFYFVQITVSSQRVVSEASIKACCVAVEKLFQFNIWCRLSFNPYIFCDFCPFVFVNMSIASKPQITKWMPTVKPRMNRFHYWKQWMNCIKRMWVVVVFFNRPRFIRIAGTLLSTVNDIISIVVVSFIFFDYSEINERQCVEIWLHRFIWIIGTESSSIYN